MSEPTPPRRPLATFLRATPAEAPATVAGEITAVPVEAADTAVAAQPSAAPAPLPEDGGAADISADKAVPLMADAGSAVNSSGDAQAPASSAPAAHAAAAPMTDEPVFLRGTTPAAPVPRWQWAVVAALSVALLLQIAIADRARLAADPSTRPLIAGLCSVLRCGLPAWHEPAAYTMVSREVRPVPGQPGLLQIQATLRNDARWDQAWPSLKLTLSDADGRVIGSGAFTASQYLPSGTAVESRLAPGQSAQVAFQVREPAASTVAFTFDFL